MTSFSVRNGRDQEIQFDGELLADVSSERPDAPRWMELRLYKTLSGTYILEKVGASKVVHMPGCTEPFDELPRFQDQHPGEDPLSSDWWMCRTCCNGSVDITALEIEQHRFTAVWSDNPQEILDRLYRSKHGAKSLQKTSVDLLDAASEVDEGIASAYRSIYVP